MGQQTFRPEEPLTGDAGWARELLGHLKAMSAADPSLAVDRAMLERAVGLVPARPEAMPILEELARLAVVAGDRGLLTRVFELRRLARPPAAPRASAEARGSGPAAGEAGLLLALAGKPIRNRVHVLHVIGAHRYQERELLHHVFPCLERVVLFEPHPQLAAGLRSALSGDARVTVLPWAISDRCGTAPFHLTDNDAASSSLLRMKRHRELFPHVHEVETIEVPVRTLPAAIEEGSLPHPDALLVDVQGAEYRVLSTLGRELCAGLALIYTEASTEEVYEGARPLDELAEALRADFQLIGFAALCAQAPTHGNALFVRRGLVPEAIGSRP